MVKSQHKKKRNKANDDEELRRLKLPDQWPMSTKRPTDSYSFMAGANGESDEFGESDDMDIDEKNKVVSSDEGQYLTPGPCLQSCSGADVQLTRGASARPNLAKGKGRFLIVLPGIMSLKSLQSTKEQSTITKPLSQDNSTSLTQDTDTDCLTQDTSDANEGGDSASQTEDMKPEASVAKPAVPKLGRIEKLGTDEPVLKIPFGDGRVLSFAGKKVNSSSKFMMMTCKSNKGTVACKDMFNSAIVFGDGVWENGNSEASVATESDPVDDAKPSLKHYGGSYRTVNGGGNGASKKPSRIHSERRKAMASRSRMERPAARKEEVEEDYPSESDEIEIIDDDDSEEEYVVQKWNGVPGDIENRRKTPRRSVSHSKVSYVDVDESEGEGESSEDEEENENSDMDSVEDNVPPKNTKSSRGVHAPKNGNKVVSGKPSNQLSSTRKTPSRPKSPSIASDEEDFMATSDEDDETNPPQRKRAPRRSELKSRASYVDVPESEKSVDERSSEDEDDVPEPSKTAQARNRRQSKGEKEPETEDTDDEKKPAPKISVANRKSSTKTKTASIPSDEEDDFHATSEMDNDTKRTKMPRRRASRLKVRYTDFSGSEDDDSEESFAEEEAKEGSKEQAKAEPAAKKNARKQKENSDVEVIELDDDSDEGKSDPEENDYCENSERRANSAARANRGRSRKSRMAPKRKNEKSPDAIGLDDVTNKSSPLPAPKKAKTGQGSSARKSAKSASVTTIKKDPKLGVTRHAEETRSDTELDSNHGSGKPTKALGALSPESSNKLSAAKRDSFSSPVSSRTPRRRRSPKKRRSPAKRELNVTDDVEFIFLE